MMEDHPLGPQEQILPPEAGAPGASTDFADVTWMLPAAEFNAATWVPGTPAHSWQAVAANGMSIGQKGMMVAAKTLALTALDLFHDAQHVRLARESFDKRRGGLLYKSRLPEGQKAPLNYRDTGARP
jgi:aminobenzoyl-glutamate utilization protein B